MIFDSPVPLSWYRGVSDLCMESPGIWAAARMSPQLSKLYSYSEAAIIRAQCASGVRIVFATDSPWVRLRWRAKRIAREVLNGDLEVKGFPVAILRAQKEGDDYVFTADLPGNGLRQVTIYLPHLLEMRVLALELAEGAVRQDVEENRTRLLFLGDSILQGMTTTSPVKAYGTALARELDYDYLNLAVGGAVMNGNVAEAAAVLPWDVAMVAFGVNDCNQGVSLEKEAAETEKTLQALTGRNKPVVLFTPLPWPGQGDKKLQDFIDCQKQVAANFPLVKVLEGYQAVSIDEENFIDTAHPNDLGNLRIAQFLAKNWPFEKQA